MLLLAPGTAVRLRPRCPPCRATFNFAESARVKPQQQGRRNRAVEKKGEQELRVVVHGLCAFNNKQLAAVAHLLEEEHLRQIRIAMDIPPTNQGRRRQEALVAKLLRGDLDAVDLGKLGQAVAMAQRNNLPYTDSDVEQQLDYWIQGLLDNDREATDEVYRLLQEGGQDWQQLRTWVRQVQQHQQHQRQQRQQQEQQQASEAVVGPQPAVAVDPEVQQLMQELAVQQQQQGAARVQASRSAATVRRSIRRMLKPLAVAQQAA